MSNTLRRKSKKAIKKRNKGFNSWAYVIFASIIDVIFSFSWHESQPSEPIFDLSAALGPLGRERQDKLGFAFVFLFEIALIGFAIYIYKNCDNRDWIGFGIVAGVVGLFLLIHIIIAIHKKHK